MMANYVAILIVQYLVSGPMRAPGGVPETALLPRASWLPFILHGTRAHAGILLALLATLLVWTLLRKTPLGYELIVSGLSPAAARYGGIKVGVRLVLAAFMAGGLGALAGTVEVLGEQHRLMDGISGGVGFTGIIVALLAKLNPLAVIPAAVLYGGMTVGANAMQRRAGIPSSITFILQSLIVLMVLASDIFRRYRLQADMNVHRLMTSAFFVTWLAASLRLSGPVLLAALGETFAERSGVLNVGIEGTILLGALASFLTDYVTGMVWMSLFGGHADRHRLQSPAGLDVRDCACRPGRGRVGVQRAGARHCRYGLSPRTRRIGRPAECGHVSPSSYSVVERSSFGRACLVWPGDTALFDAGAGCAGPR